MKPLNFKYLVIKETKTTESQKEHELHGTKKDCY